MTTPRMEPMNDDGGTEGSGLQAVATATRSDLSPRRPGRDDNGAAKGGKVDSETIVEAAELLAHVTAFADEMLAKLLTKAGEGVRGWDDRMTVESLWCWRQLQDRVAALGRGEHQEIDIANLAMFIWHYKQHAEVDGKLKILVMQGDHGDDGVTEGPGLQASGSSPRRPGGDGNGNGYDLAEAARWAISQIGPIEYLATHPDRQWRCVYCHAEAAHSDHVTHTAECSYARARAAIATADNPQSRTESYHDRCERTQTAHQGPEEDAEHPGAGGGAGTDGG